MKLSGCATLEQNGHKQKAHSLTSTEEAGIGVGMMLGEV